MPIFHTPLPRDNATTVQKAIRKIRFDTHENFYVFRNNKQIQRYKGTINFINPDPKYFISKPNDIWVHNHPGGSSFSPDDIQMAVFHNVKSFFLSTPNFFYLLERIGNSWPFNPEEPFVNEYLLTCQNRTNEFLDKLIQKNEISLLEKDEIIFHYIWQSFFQKYEANYIQKEF